MSLGPEQLADARVTRAARAIPVLAWVPWTDGRYHRIAAFAGEWTSSAVRVRWREGGGTVHDVWVWADAVRRASEG